MQSGTESRNESLRKLQRALAKRSLLAFSEYLGYENAAHHRAIYSALGDRKIRRLITIIPPGHGKSTCVSINYPLWALGRNPNLRFIIASHTKDFVASFIREIMSWMQRPEYIELFGDLKPAHPGSPGKWAQNEIIVNRTRILKDPSITALGVEQATIGRRADEVICDDIVDEDWASSEVLRERLRTWFKKELLPRLEPEGRLVAVGTRWHFADLYAELLKEDIYQKIVCPAVTESNQVLWPERWPLERLLQIKNEIGSIMWAAQYLCNPTPMEGTVFKAEWLHYWHPTDESVNQRIYKLPPREKLHVFQGWDLAISEDPSADWTVCVTLGIAQEGAVYVLDVDRNHLDFPAQVSRVKALADAWHPETIAIESNAYQRALPQWLRRGLLPVIQVKQTTDKIQRLTGLGPYFENGTIRVNISREDLILEYLQFPKGEHDDILDALNLALHAARRYIEPGATIFEPPSIYQGLERQDDRERFIRGMR